MASRKYRTERFIAWEDFRQVIGGDEYKGWAFRGQADARWPLYSSLSRYLMTYQIHPEAWPMQEARILRIFKRKAHLLLTHLPLEENSFEWLALMQHHGAPTRLIDFSWSPFVATYFAIERATADAAVWALFPPALTERQRPSKKAAQPDRGAEFAPWVEGGYEKHFLPNKNRMVVAGEPQRMNQRLVAQSGTFVMPGVLDAPVEELVPPGAAVKFVLDTKSMRKRAMMELYHMNMSNATLFPGLDGLARSLGYELEFHWAFDPVTMERRKGFSDD
jgi:hypothetical protein